MRATRLEVAQLRNDLVKMLAGAPVSDSERISVLAELTHSYARRSVRAPRKGADDPALIPEPAEG